LKVTDVRGANSIAEFQSAGPDQRNSNTLGLALAVDLSGPESNRDGDRLDGNAGQQLVKKALSPVAAFGCIGPSNPVGKFKDGHDRNSNTLVTGFQCYGFEQF
jgi:hypothetical protein